MHETGRSLAEIRWKTRVLNGSPSNPNLFVLHGHDSLYLGDQTTEMCSFLHQSLGIRVPDVETVSRMGSSSPE